MEKEINKIKIEYQLITPPKSLVDNGLNNLWLRVDIKKPSFKAYFLNIAAVILIFVLLAEFIGISSAQAKPGSVLYPVKIFTQKAVTAFSKTPIFKFYNSQIIQNHVDETIPNPTQPNSPTPEEKNEKSSENKKSEGNSQNNLFKNEDGGDSNSKEDVKGASTLQNNKKSDEKESQAHLNNSGNNQDQNKTHEDNVEIDNHGKD